MINSLILSAAMLLPGQTIYVQSAQVWYIQPAPQVQYVLPANPRPVNYLTPLRPGDMLIKERVGLFGWRSEYRLYRSRR